MVKGRRLLLKREKKKCTCLGFIKRLKIPTTCSLPAPTCLYSCDCWVTAAQPHNMRQKCQVSHAHGLGCVLYTFGSQAREDSEHAKFKVNSRESSKATSRCWELPCNFFLFVPILHSLLLTGWRFLYKTVTIVFISRYGTQQEMAKHQQVFCTKELVTNQGRRTHPNLQQLQNDCAAFYHFISMMRNYMPSSGFELFIPGTKSWPFLSKP